MTEQILRNFETTRQKVVSILSDYVICGYIENLSKILVYMGEKNAEEMLLKIPEPVQRKIRESYKNLSGKKISDPDIIAAALRVLKDGGFFGKEICDSISKDLNSWDKEELLYLTNELFEKDPLIAMSVEKNLISFDILRDIHDRTIQKILRKTNQDTLAKALVKCSPDISDKIFRNLSKRAAENLKEDIEYMGAITKTDIDKARDKIIETIVMLSKEGEIVLS